MTAAERLALRTAIEALRAGVPNRAAVSLLGSVEDALEERFEAGLELVANGKPALGMLFAGGFGAGKSHLLGFLREIALRQNFITSRVTISKETPLSAPLVMFSAALRDTVVPGHTDDALAVAVAELQRRPAALEALEAVVSAPDAKFAPVFAAILHLLRRQAPAELVRRVEAFLAGGKLPGTALRQALTQAGARGVFDLAHMTETTLALQRERFIPLLFRAVGFAGWCVLIDEVELIGRYSPLQRARAYAELARWLAIGAIRPFPGLYAAAGITDDFASEVINSRQDDEKLPERLRLKGMPELADAALAAMRAIKAAPVLSPPAEADLQRYVEILRRSYGAAYDWRAPTLPVGERRTNRTMRHHIRGWITQWDLLRLQGRTTGTEVAPLGSNYAETADLDERASPPENES